MPAFKFELVSGEQSCIAIGYPLFTVFIDNTKLALTRLVSRKGYSSTACTWLSSCGVFCYCFSSLVVPIKDSVFTSIKHLLFSSNISVQVIVSVHVVCADIQNNSHGGIQIRGCF